MAGAKEKLTHLIELATKPGLESRRALVSQLCDLLMDWPASYPEAMREPFEALLEKAAREVDGETRKVLADRLATFRAAPIGLLNTLFIDAGHDAKVAILKRNAEAAGAGDTAAQVNGKAPDHESALVSLARKARGDEFTRAFAQALGVEPGTAGRILRESSGDALAVACKGAHLTRSTFSALAVLFAPKSASTASENYRRLGAYDEVPQNAAEQMIRFWQSPAARGAAKQTQAA